MPPPHIRRRPKKVLFPRSSTSTTRRRTTPSTTTMASSSTNPPTPVENLNTILDNLRVQELSSSDTSEPASSPAAAESYYPYNPSNPYIPPAPPAPALFTTLPLLRDALTTRSSVDQDATVNSCIRYLGYPEDPFPILDRENHIAFLESGLTSKLPDYMVAYDASRAWLVYWCLSGLASLGVDLAKYRARVMDTLRPLQNAEGGFGGGNGQMSHITATYAAVLALCLVSPRPTAATTPNDNDREEEEDKEAEETPLDLIDRRAMLKYLHSVKVPETGGFRVAINGESDVRGCYCALVIITLLGLPTSNGLVRGTRGYLSRCQTFEGGFGATPDGNEAHGGYAFCALAALCMLGEPREVMTSSLDMGRLIAWLSARQYAPEGGLSGRTNKLVDGCYSTWVGGCWPLVEAACNGPQKPGELVGGVVGSLWSREGLARYILACCQNMKGGMRDKPNKAPDFYHTCYVLLGLSSAQHYSYYTPSPETLPASAPLAGEEGENEDLPLRSAFTWRVSEKIPSVVKGVYEPVVEDIPTWPDDVAEEGAVGDRLKPHHPIFNIPLECVEAAERWVAGRVGF